MNADEFIKLAEQQHEHSLDEMKKSLKLHQPFLKEMGINFKEESFSETEDEPVATLSTAAVGISASSITVKRRWWGIDIIMDKQLTDDIVSGIIGAGAVATIINGGFIGAGIVTGPVGAVIAAGIAGIVALKIAEVRLANRGKGVHWPISWFQWAALLAALPSGPAGVAMAGVVFLHPVPNR